MPGEHTVYHASFIIIGMSSYPRQGTGTRWSWYSVAFTSLLGTGLDFLFLFLVPNTSCSKLMLPCLMTQGNKKLETHLLEAVQVDSSGHVDIRRYCGNWGGGGGGHAAAHPRNPWPGSRTSVILCSQPQTETRSRAPPRL